MPRRTPDDYEDESSGCDPTAMDIISDEEDVVAPKMCSVDELVPFQVIRSNGQCVQIECNRSRTNSEAIILAGEKPEDLGDIVISTQLHDLDHDQLISTVHGRTLYLRRSCKRKEPSIPYAVLELTLLDGQTRFVPCVPSMSIRQALQHAAYPDLLIDKLTPLSNGLRVELDAVLSQLDTPHVRLICHPLKGGTKTNAKGKSKGKNEDPLQLNDPWKNPAPTNASCRWEQLRLSDSHPFYCKQTNKRLTQVPGAQAGSHGGVIFATKSMLRDFVGIKPPGTTLLLLPGFRGASNIEVPQGFQVLAPQQVVVHEPVTKWQYKRLILPILVTGQTEFKIGETPQDVSITSVKFKELVIEFHSALISNATAQSIAEHPLNAFKKALTGTGVALVELSVYSYRAIKTHDLQTLHQAIIKVPADVVNDLLSASGSRELFIRAYVNDNESLDHTLLSRFWTPTWEDLRTVRQLAPTVGQSFRGIALTSKGLAIRALNSDLSAARQAILPADVRCTDANRHVVPKFFFLRQGFPFEISHESVIKATMEATKAPPILLRSFKLAGLHTWVLAFGEQPAVMAFNVKLESQIFEVLLMVQTSMKQKPKKIVKNQAAASSAWRVNEPPITVTSNMSQADHKINALAERVNKLETQQTALAEKVDTRFDQVSMQLQQVLQAVAPSNQQPRVRGQEGGSGETPPPKSTRVQ